MLKQLFSPLINTINKPKWKHRNPKTRIQGILESLEPGSPELESIALEDIDNDVKCCAIKRITDINTIQTIIMKSADKEIKETASQRFCEILSGNSFPVADIEIRKTVIKNPLPQKISEYLLVHAKESELRLLAVENVGRPSLLGDIALKDSNSEVRVAAVKKINKKSTLQRISKASRSKDKKIYKLAKEQLDKIIEEEQRPQLISQEIIEICDQLEKMYKRQLLIQEEHTFIKLSQRWHEIKNFANKENTIRYHNIADQIKNALHKAKFQLQREAEIKTRLEQLLIDINQQINHYLQADEDSKEEISEQLSLLDNDWQSLITELTTKTVQKNYQEKYLHLIELMEGSESSEHNTDAYDQLNKYLRQAQSLIANKEKQFISRQFVDKLIANIDTALHLTEGSEHYESLHSRSTQLKQQLDSACLEQQAKITDCKHKSSLLTEEIKTALQQGNTELAIHKRQQFQKLLDNSLVLSLKDKQQLQDQLKEENLQLNQLSGWKKWAVTNERQNLCNQSENILNQIKNGLLQQPQSIAELYLQYSGEIKSLRHEWKQLKGRANDDLWEKFNQHCNEVFELFRPYLDQQHQNRELNKERKQQICQQLEDYIKHMNWPEDDSDSIDKNIDWKQVHQIIRTARLEWNSIGHVQQTDYNKINNRYKKSLKIIEKELDKAWESNARAFSTIIEQVKELHPLVENNLQDAVKQCKTLQNEWKKIGPTQQKRRKLLWKKFRTACDFIFNQREKLNHEKTQQLDHIGLEKKALCENLEALNQQQLEITSYQQAFNDIKQLWDELYAQKSYIDKEVHQRFSKAKKVFSSQFKTMQFKQKIQQLKLLREKALLCSKIEARDKDSLAEKSADFMASWNSIEKLSDTTLNDSINDRFERALESVEKNTEKLHNKKEKLCLQLEILTGHDSPDDLSEKRLAMRVEQLNANLHQSAQVTDNNNLFKLAEQWFLLAYTGSMNDSLEQRFISVLDNNLQILKGDLKNEK